MVAFAAASGHRGHAASIARSAGAAQSQSAPEAVPRRDQRADAVRGGLRRTGPRPDRRGGGHPLPQRRGRELHRALHAAARSRLHGGGRRRAVGEAALRRPLRHPVRTAAHGDPALARRAGTDRPAVRIRRPRVRLRFPADRPQERGLLRRRTRRSAGDAARHRHRGRLHAARHHLSRAALSPHLLRRQTGGGAQPDGRPPRDPLPQPVSGPERQERGIRRAAHHRRERGLDHRPRLHGRGGHPLRQHRHHHARGRQRRRQERDAGARAPGSRRPPAAGPEYGDRRAPLHCHGADPARCSR